MCSAQTHSSPYLLQSQTLHHSEKSNTLSFGNFKVKHSIIKRLQSQTLRHSETSNSHTPTFGDLKFRYSVTRRLQTQIRHSPENPNNAPQLRDLKFKHPITRKIPILNKVLPNNFFSTCFIYKLCPNTFSSSYIGYICISYLCRSNTTT